MTVNLNSFCLPLVERSLLSLSLNSQDAYYAIVAKIDAKDFLDITNSSLFIVLGSLNTKGITKFDLPIVLDEAKRLGIDNEIGGLNYIRAISNMDIDVGNVDIYIRQLLNNSTKLKLHSVLRKHETNVMGVSNDTTENIDDMISSVEFDILNISSESKSIEEPKQLGDGLEEYIEERLSNRTDVSGISSGFPILDKMIDGLIPGTLFVVAARMKEGKSALLTKMSLNVAIQQKIPVLYVDTELTFDEWRTRALASISTVPERAIKHGNLDASQLERIHKAISNIKQAKIFHHYMPGYSVDKLITLFNKYKLKENIGMAVFDYLKEPDSSSIDRNRKEHQVLGDVTTQLKDLAGKLNIPVLTAVQLNRAGDVADSDRVARYGDVITFWSTRYKDNEEDKVEQFERGTHKLVIRTTRRGGATGPAGILFDFTKKILSIKELPIFLQPQDFDKLLKEEQGETRNQHKDDDELR